MKTNRVIRVISPVFQLAFLLQLLFFLPSCQISGSSAEGQEQQPRTALERLLEGNQRFVSGKIQAPNRDEERRLQTVAEQHPFAAVLTCSDSRISPTLIFDTGIGDIFIVRTAGNVIGEIEIASLEYAVKHLNVDVVLIMGHTDCGAIKAFVSGKREDGHIQVILDSLRNEPEEMEALRQPVSVRLNSCVQANIIHQARFVLQHSTIIAEKVRKGELQLVEAEYDHKSGKVEIMHVYPERIAKFSLQP